MLRRFRWITINLAALVLAAPGSQARTALELPVASLPSSALKVSRHAKADELPFWKKKPSLVEKIRNERAILVSVRADPAAQSDDIVFTMNGAGVVRRPKEFCFKVAQDYPRLKTISEHFKTVSFDSPSRQLFLVTEALGLQARMVMRITPVSEDWRSELQWEVVWGHFKGMTGWIGFEKTDSDRTEMSLSARYQARELPLPKSLVGFALEVVAQKVAERMRAFLEAAPAEAAEKAAPVSASRPVRADLKPELIKLPRGFKLRVFADDVPDARQMALSEGGALFVGSPRQGKVFVIEGAADSAARGEQAKPAKVLLSGLDQPNGVAVHGAERRCRSSGRTSPRSA